MAKFTSKYVRDAFADMIIDMSPAAMEVSEKKRDPKTKKVKAVINPEATVENVKLNLAYYRGFFDSADIFEPRFPEGISELLNDYKAQWQELFDYLAENYPDEFEAFSDGFGILGYEDLDAAEGEEDEAPDYSGMSLAELRNECKERSIKFSPRDKENALIEKLEADDAANSGEDEEPDDSSDAAEGEEDEAPDYSGMSLAELRNECKERGIRYSPKLKEADLISMLEEADANSGDDEESDDSGDEAPDYSGMSLAELRNECKERSIKFSPRDKSDALIAKLEADDAASDESGDDAEDGEAEDETEVSEEEVDKVLDEEFEDETLAEEEAASPAKGRKAAKKGRK